MWYPVTIHSILPVMMHLSVERFCCLLYTSPFGVPIDVIPMQDYGMCNGKGVLEFALSLIEKKDGGC